MTEKAETFTCGQNCNVSELQQKVTMEESFIFQAYFVDYMYVHRPSI